jgi:hypothetical protein
MSMVLCSVCCMNYVEIESELHGAKIVVPICKQCQEQGKESHVR